MCGAEIDVAVVPVWETMPERLIRNRKGQDSDRQTKTLDIVWPAVLATVRASSLIIKAVEFRADDVRI